MNQEQILQLLEPRKTFNEINDCTVRALSVAMNINYDIAHKFCAKHNRWPRKGFSPLKLFEEKVINGKIKLPWKRFKGIILIAKIPKRRMTIPTFIKRYPEGKFVCVKSGHAFAVIDGKIFGQNDDHSRILYFIKIKLPK